MFRTHDLSVKRSQSSPNRVPTVAIRRGLQSGNFGVVIHCAWLANHPASRHSASSHTLVSASAAASRVSAISISKATSEVKEGPEPNALRPSVDPATA